MSSPITKLAGSIGHISADVHSDTGGYSPPSHQKQEQDLPQEDSRKEQPREQSSLKLVEKPSVDPEAFFKNALNEPPPPVVEEAKPKDPYATGQTGKLVQAFAALQDKKEAVVQWLGSRTYAAGRARGKRTAAKKGIIVNKQVD